MVLTSFDSGKRYSRVCNSPSINKYDTIHYYVLKFCVLYIYNVVSDHIAYYACI